jgi:hypothetical protein
LFLEGNGLRLVQLDLRRALALGRAGLQPYRPHIPELRGFIALEGSAVGFLQSQEFRKELQTRDKEAKQ